MKVYTTRLGAAGVGLGAFLACLAPFAARSLKAQVEGARPVENGIVYYSVGPIFKPLEKVRPLEGAFAGSATVKEAHSSIRLDAGQPHAFRVCGVDPTRYKLYVFQSTGKSRTLKIANSGVWKGTATVVMSQSEIPLKVRAIDGDCFEISPEQALDDGEYGFNIVESRELFMFGVDGHTQVRPQAPVPMSTPAPLAGVTPREVGIVYYANGSEFRQLEKKVAVTGGRPIMARASGAHSPVRLSDGQPYTFRICGVDPTRYKLYKLEVTKKERTLLLAKIGVWGTMHDVSAESELPVSIQTAEDKCYVISPKEPLTAGEYGFSPVGAEDVFLFGVGDVKLVK